MSKRQVKNYTEEFKLSSAKIASESNQAIKITAQELGVHPTTLCGWVKRYYPNTLKNHHAGTQEDLVSEVKRLRKENRRLTEERNILKKATAYFASDLS